MIGQRIGSYRVIRPLGEGGMGAVYEAVHEQIGSRAAIKVLHPELSRKPELAARFFNEARAVNLIQHPSLVRIFEFGHLPGPDGAQGAAFIIMELLEGESLSHRLRRVGPLGLSGASLCRQIASALQAAHARNIVHRDLKPDNVMIVPDPEAASGERVKILDFGIAKFQDDAGKQGAVQTRTGLLLGTPQYMSPEQCRGAGGVDAKADVYALGVILYEVLAGAPPFVAEGLGELMALHMLAPPPPLAGVPAAQGLPPGLVALTHAMLAKDPSARPDMAQVILALEAAGVTRGTGALPAPGLSAPLQVLGPPSQAGSQRSTLGNSLGEFAPAVHTAHAPRSPLRARPVLFGGAIALLLLGVGALRLGGVVGPRHKDDAVIATAGPGGIVPAPAPAPAPPGPVQVQAPPPAPPPVRWSLRSEPPGAAVLDAGSGAGLGATPLLLERPAAEGQLAVVLRRPGFQDLRLTLDRSHDEDRSERLEPARPQRTKRRDRRRHTDDDGVELIRLPRRK